MPFLARWRSQQARFGTLARTCACMTTHEYTCKVLSCSAWPCPQTRKLRHVYTHTCTALLYASNSTCRRSCSLGHSLTHTIASPCLLLLMFFRSVAVSLGGHRYGDVRGRHLRSSIEGHSSPWRTSRHRTRGLCRWCGYARCPAGCSTRSSTISLTSLERHFQVSDSADLT
jgi:hypothetical protein